MPEAAAKAWLHFQLAWLQDVLWTLEAGWVVTPYPAHELEPKRLPTGIVCANSLCIDNSIGIDIDNGIENVVEPLRLDVEVGS